MRAAAVLREVLEGSGMTKSSLSMASGVSRALLDDYLNDRRQPSVAQLDRLVSAAGFDLAAELTRKPKPVPPEFVAVLDFGDLFPRKEPEPLVNLGPLWRRVRTVNA